MNPNPYKASFTPAAANATGYATAQTGAVWTLATTTAADGLGHLTRITNNSATDHSAKTCLITGTDANGLPQTETLALPAASTTRTGVKYFKTVTSIVPSASIGADTMGLGWEVTSVSPWVTIDYRQAAFAASLAVVLVSGTITFSGEHTYDQETGAAVPFTKTGMSGVSASTDVIYTAPVRAVRIKVTASNAAVFNAYVMQGADT